MNYQAIVKVSRIDPNPGKLACDTVLVLCDHSRYSRKVILTAYLAKLTERPFMLDMTQSEHEDVEPMARLNRKRLENLQSLTRNQVAMRQGRAWDLVVRLCDKHSLATETPTETPA